MTELPPGIQGVTEPVSSSGFFRFERLVLRLRCRFVPTDHARRFKRAADAPPPAALSPMASDGGPPRSTAGGTGTRRSREGHFRYLVGELRNSHLAPPHRCPCRSREGHFRYLVALQVLTKLVSFVFNSWCMGAVEGFSATSFVDRVLYYREGFRRGCLHGGFGFDEEVTDNSTAKLLKVARMTFPIGIVATTVGCIHELWKQKIKLSDPSAAFGFEDPYVQAILISGIACILELLAEPLYILSQNLFLLKLRMISEVVATLMRCMTAYILIKNSNMETVVVFPLSQAMYGACLLFAYWFYFLSCHVPKLHCVMPCRTGWTMIDDYGKHA